jgi:hypothetical protein
MLHMMQSQPKPTSINRHADVDAVKRVAEPFAAASWWTAMRGCRR